MGSDGAASSANNMVRSTRILASQKPSGPPAEADRD
eukprot:CAMPEP_0174895606 /NCGR_PEP_ID=MMETSP0167-20121228/9993_1 /TAXON_ID=38298 /ORGANISM="Rhodella maculata, Strain CCMP736" /LENGTH=35 /DNA_ID= /DNA_START= /DNA_END= /DNA_ORIENTATION=